MASIWKIGVRCIEFSMILLSVLTLSAPIQAISVVADSDLKVVAYNDYRLPDRVEWITHRHPKRNLIIHDDVVLAESCLSGWIDTKLNWHSNWKSVVVFVSNDEQAGQAFADYLARGQGQVLQLQDFRSLSSLWAKVTICYIYVYHKRKPLKGKPIILYPYADPQHWWQVKPLYDASAALKAQHRPSNHIIFSSEPPREPSYITNQRVNQQVQVARKGVNTQGLDLPPN